MKKILVSLTIMLLSIMLLITNSNAAFSINTKIESNSDTIQTGETITLVITSNEKIIASNFNINYDNTILKLEGSKTSNLSVAEKDGKIACIYADISGTGTTEFKIQFKTLKETTSSATVLSIEDAKFRAEGKEESYTGESILGLNKEISIKVEKVATKENSSDESNVKEETEKEIVEDKTTKKSNLPNTGKSTGLIILGIIILVLISIIFGKKSKELNKIFSSISIFVLTLVVVTTLNSRVYAATVETTVTAESIYDTIGIILNIKDCDRMVTNYEISTKAEEISSILDDNKKSLSDTSIIKTGFLGTTVTDKVCPIVLYGDANGDGIICDTDDLMMIINHYLGKETISSCNFWAANLANNDSILDTDDLMQMINMYLGKLDNSLLTSEAKGEILLYPDFWTKIEGSYIPVVDSASDTPSYYFKDGIVRLQGNYTMEGTYKIEGIKIKIKYTKISGPDKENEPIDEEEELTIIDQYTLIFERTENGTTYTAGVYKLEEKQDYIY